MKNMDGICQVLPCYSMCLRRHLLVNNTFFLLLTLNGNAHHLLSFHGPFFPANLQEICMKLDGRQVETPLNMDPPCTDQS